MTLYSLPPVTLRHVTVQPPVDVTQDGADFSASPTRILTRTIWFEGEGPPPEEGIPGTKVGDRYLDTLTSDVYALED
jgi:hypothetical protein